MGLNQSFLRSNRFSFTLTCNDIDAGLNDVEGGCDERMQLAVAIAALLLNDPRSLQEIAIENGLEYEPCLSPRNGYPMLPSCLELEYDGKTFFWEWEDIPVNKAMIRNLLRREDGSYYLQNPREASNSAIPVFTDPPVYDDTQAAEGIIKVIWDSEGYMPIERNDTLAQSFERIKIEESFEFVGHGLSDFTENYAYQYPADMQKEIEKLLGKQSVGRLLVPTLNHILELSLAGTSNNRDSLAIERH